MGDFFTSKTAVFLCFTTKTELFNNDNSVNSDHYFSGSGQICGQIIHWFGLLLFCEHKVSIFQERCVIIIDNKLSSKESQKGEKVNVFFTVAIWRH